MRTVAEVITLLEELQDNFASYSHALDDDTAAEWPDGDAEYYMNTAAELANAVAVLAG